MSFAFEVKKEICKNALSRHRDVKARAYGLLLFGKTFGADSITLHTEHKMVARYYIDAITDLCGVCSSLTLREIRRGKSRPSIFLAEVDDRQDRLEILSRFGGGQQALHIQEQMLGDHEIPAFLSGVFLACGTLADPQKSYHAEFSTPSRTLYQDLGALLSEHLSAPKETSRRNDYVLYYKESEQIEDLLTFMGAMKSSLTMMEIKVIKEVRNKVNRETNCETANLTKTVNAALEQTRAIERIDAALGLENLESDLQELAKLRLENADMSLRELGEALSKPLSRSGVHHRLQRLVEMASTLPKGKQE